MNVGNNKEHISSCFFHPNHQLIGVCPFCLNERLLLILASSTKGGFSRKKLAIKKLPKIFALGSLLHRLEFMHWKKQNFDVSVSASQEDSFISIKFEENGVASWEKGNVKSKVSIEHCRKSWYPTLTKEVPKEANKSVIEHAKPRASHRWRKRIGHLSQLIKWKSSSKVNGNNMTRTLTKRTKE